MERVVYDALGRPSRSVVVGPGVGLDNGVVSIGKGRVMVVTVDPVSAIPAIGMKLSAWLSVHLVASDLATSGVDPKLAVFSYNFPPAMAPSEREVYVRSIGAECGRLGISIVAGHTGTYPGGGFTVIGSGTMLGFAAPGGYVTPSMAQIGDAVLMTKSAAIEATASLALSFPRFVEGRVGRRLAARARALVRACSTVSDARAARKPGIGRRGVTSMHDATEGGVLGALGEMAAASGKQFAVDARMIPVSAEASAVCSAFGLDPLSTMGEGAMLITCRPGTVGAVARALASEGIDVRQVGDVKKGTGLRVTDGPGKARCYAPEKDRYWSAYEESAGRGLG